MPLGSAAALLPLLLAAPFASGLPVSDADVKAAELSPRAVPGLSGEISLWLDKDDAFSPLVLKALPAFAAVGREAFGADLPPVSLYLLSDGARYRAFTEAAFGEARMTGTGNLHIVTMCLSCERRRPEETETTAVVLHEFGHAWLNSYLRERYGVDYLSPAVRRPYLDEGIADFFAGRWDKEFLARRRDWIRRLKTGKTPPPALAELQTYRSFYDHGDRELHYWLSALLVERMLGDAPGSSRKIRTYLDSIGRGRTPEKAWESATGKSLAAEYGALVNELWRNPSSTGERPSASAR